MDPQKQQLPSLILLNNKFQYDEWVMGSGVQSVTLDYLCALRQWDEYLKGVDDRELHGSRSEFALWLEGLF